MPRKRDRFVPLGDVAGAVELPGGRARTHRAAAPAPLRHFTRLDQVTQLVGASEADAELGFIARLLALCSLPRTNPGHRHQYKRVNGPYTLVMLAGADNKLPYGNIPRLLLAWVTTEAVRVPRQLLLPLSVNYFCRLRGAGVDIEEDDAGAACGRRLRRPKRGGKRATVMVHLDTTGCARFPRRWRDAPARPAR